MLETAPNEQDGWNEKRTMMDERDDRVSESPLSGDAVLAICGWLDRPHRPPCNFPICPIALRFHLPLLSSLPCPFPLPPQPPPSIAKMTSLSAQVHIDTTSATSAGRTLPDTPIPLTGEVGSQLPPSTELKVPIKPAREAGGKPEELEELANAMDEARASLNTVLTAWKDWAGKEEVLGSNKKGEEEEDEEEEDEEEE